jgi:hypothetical protein
MMWGNVGYSAFGLASDLACLRLVRRSLAVLPTSPWESPSSFLPPFLIKSLTYRSDGIKIYIGSGMFYSQSAGCLVCRDDSDLFSLGITFGIMMTAFGPTASVTSPPLSTQL